MIKAVYSSEAGESGNAGSVSERISERYGIPPTEVEALLKGTKPIPQGEPHPMTMGALMGKEQSTQTMATGDNNKWNPTATLGMILGILGILSLVVAILLIARWRGGPDHPPMIRMADMPDHAVVTPAPPYAAPRVDTAKATVDSSAKNVLQPRVDVVIEPSELVPENAKPKKLTAKRAPTVKHFATSNSIEAQERLAEMRAEGNKKARVQRITKNGVTLYQVK